MRLLAVLLFATASLAAPPPAPKNVILLIADGTGLAHWTALKQNKPDANLTRLPVVGLATTHCLNRAVTDSAAAASAIATGSKVNYEAVSEAPDGKPLTTVLEAAESAGKATGVVTTAYFYDATPAAFAAHAKHRDQYAEIVGQMIRSGAEVIAGTGLKPLGQDELAALPVAAQEQGYTVVTDRAGLDAAPAASPVLAVFPKQTRDLDFPGAPLPLLTRFAIDRLKGDKDGFFLMIEHEGTDSSSHHNNIPDTTASLKSFDEAIGIALDFAAKNPDTLVVVTSDHETGGLRVSETKSARFRLEWSATDHTGVAVPVFAFGPGASEFGGFYDNADVGKKLLKSIGVRRP
jgi:alkaline phosphatase